MEKRRGFAMNSRLPQTSIRRRYRVDRRRIAFLKFILESYEGVALMRTIDARLGTVELLVAPGCEREVGRLLEDLRTEMRIENVPAAE